ncbi:MAG: FAD-linked oxidase C-terminal domain-containing protein, partial [Alphaproteobacteria bacterium]
NAIHGGICVDTSRMDAILAVNAEDMDATVQAGVTRNRLNDHLRDTGLFFPVDPGADASLGGMASTRASGTTAVRYGTMRENVLALTVVLADGRVIKTANRARKSSAGYDLTRLFVGAEGTLGIVTEVTLRLHGIPEASLAAICPFPSFKQAVDSVIVVIHSGIPVARIEFVDEVVMRAMNLYSRTDYPEEPHLFLEFHGSEAEVREQAERAEAIAAEYGGKGFQWATRAEERNKLWKARHDVAHAVKVLRPGAELYSGDVCVPISRLAECVAETREDLDGSFLISGITGHVGDGNFHAIFLIDPDDPRDMAEVNRLNDAMVERALAMGGTCTGEHGVGQGKKKFMVAEHGEGIAVMRQIKQALDPQGILNPGKVLPG